MSKVRKRNIPRNFGSERNFRTHQIKVKPKSHKAKSYLKHGVIGIVCASVILVMMFTLWPSDLNPEEFSYQVPPAFEGALSPNELLSEGVKHYEGLISGPESIAIYEGHIYTGTADGKVIDIYNNSIEVLASFGTSDCDSEATCGRPLGVRVDHEGHLIVADSYLGLYRVELKTGEYEQLISTNQTIDGKRSMFLNDVAVTSSGMIYVTDGSTRWNRAQFKLLGLEMNPNGRVLEHNPTSKETTVLCDGVYANGIELSPEEDHVIICETPTVRLLKCYITGERRGQVELFMDNLPGYPDNIRRSSDGGYWVALTAVRQPNSIPIWERMGPYPFVRDLLYKWNLLMSNDLVKQIRNLNPFAGTVKSSSKKAKKSYGMILEVTTRGQYRRSLHDPTGNMVGISHVDGSDGKLYLGSASNDFIGILEMK